MKVLLLIGSTILGLSAVLPPLITSAPAAQNAGGTCGRPFTRASRHVLRHSNITGHSVSG
jgi:hypothetical protein